MTGAAGSLPRVELADILDARPLVDQVALRTPMQEARWLSDRSEGAVWLKCENLQRAGSFKVRGAYVRVSRLTAEEKARGVVAASAGNHAQGVVLAAAQLGIEATVFMPQGAPIPKVRATRGYGAEVIFSGQYLDQALTAAIEYAERTGAVLIHPFDHADIVAGQGTCGLEILEQVPEAATVLVPTGGGGLIAGAAIAMKSLRPDVRVVGVQAEKAAAYPASLAGGAPVALTEMKTMADGIAVGRPGDIPFAAITEYVDEVVTVSEESISRALLALVERAKLVVEPAGAVAVAALMDRPQAYATPSVAVLSGGNLDPLLLGKVIQHGLASEGRYLFLRVCISDNPGGLAELLESLAQAGANVIDVTHERIDPALLMGEVDVHVQLETRGSEHSAEVRSMLADRGFRVR